MEGIIHIELWQLIGGLIVYTTAIVAVVMRFGMYVTLEKYDKDNTRYDREFAELENRLRDLELWKAGKHYFYPSD